MHTTFYFFVHLLMDRGCSCILAVVNNGAVNIGGVDIA